MIRVFILVTFAAAIILTAPATAAPSTPSLSSSTSLHTPVQKTTCPAGLYVANDGSCKLCPAGTYKEDSSRTVTKCTPCPAGTFQPSRGATTSKVCRPCYRNTFSATPGSTSCVACPLGRASGYGATNPSCVRCPAGYAVSQRGAKCVRCQSYEFSSTINAQVCTLCIYGGKPNENRSKCVKCSPNERCGQCPRAMYMLMGTGREEEGEGKVEGRCEYCPLGMSARSTSARSISACKPCPKGFYRGQWDAFCRKCEPGTVSFGSGAISCRAKKHPSSTNGQAKHDESLKSNDHKMLGSCPYGSFVNAFGDCAQCSINHFRDAKTNVCLRCPSGSASPGGLVQSCSKCPAGTRASPRTGDCTCGDGYFLEKGSKICKKCPAGTYRLDTKQRANGCVPCETGRVSGSGSRVCSRCPDGKVSNKTHTKCMKCRKGSVPNFLTDIDLYYGYGQRECVDARSGSPIGRADSSVHDH